MISPSGLLLVVPPPVCCCPSFSFMGGIEKKRKQKKLNLDVRNILAGSHTQHMAEDALSGSYIYKQLKHFDD